MEKQTEKRKFKITWAGLCVNAAFSFMAVTLVLFFLNNYFLRDRSAEQIRRSLSVSKPEGSTHLSFTEDKEHYSYVKDGKLVVKDAADNSIVEEVSEQSPVVYSFTLDDRNLIMYFTYQSSSKKLSADLDANEDIKFEKLTVSTGKTDEYESLPDESEAQSASESGKEVSGTPESDNSESDASMSESDPSSKSGSSSVSRSSSSKSSSSSSVGKSTTSSSKRDTGANNNVGIEATDTGNMELTLYTYDIEKGERTKRKSFTVRNFSKINQVEYSTLTNLIYVNVEIKNGKNLTNNIYRINIVGNVRVFSSGFQVDKIAVLKHSDTVFYQRPDNSIYRNGSKFSAIKKEPGGLDLLGVDHEDSVYFKSLKDSNKIYKYTSDNKVETIDLSKYEYTDVTKTGKYSGAVYSSSGLHLIYDNKVVNISGETPVEVYFTESTDFYGIFAQSLFMIDGQNQISYKNLQ